MHRRAVERLADFEVLSGIDRSELRDRARLATSAPGRGGWSR